MDNGGSSRVTLGQQRMRRLAPEPVVLGLPALARSRLRWRRQLERGQRRPEVETSPPDDHRRPSCRERLVHRLVREPFVVGHGGFPVEVPDADEPRRRLRLIRQDGQAAVDLHRIRRDELGGNPLRDRLGQRGLSRRGRPEDGYHPRRHASIVVFSIGRRSR